MSNIGTIIGVAAVGAAALLSTCGRGHAYERSACSLGTFYALCAPAEQPNAKVVTGLGGPDGVRREDVTDEQRLEWAKRCQPRKVFDGLTTRWVYAHVGCESGVHE